MEESRQETIRSIINAKQLLISGATRLIDEFVELGPLTSLESVGRMRIKLHEERARTRQCVLSLDNHYAVPAGDITIHHQGDFGEIVEHCRQIIEALHGDTLIMMESLEDYGILPIQLRNRKFFIDAVLESFGVNMQSMLDEEKLCVMRKKITNNVGNVRTTTLGSARLLIDFVSGLDALLSVMALRRLFHALIFIRTSTKQWILAQPVANIIPAEAPLAFPENLQFDVVLQFAADCKFLCDLIDGDLALMENVINHSDCLHLELLDLVITELTNCIHALSQAEP